MITISQLIVPGSNLSSSCVIKISFLKLETALLSIKTTTKTNKIMDVKVFKEKKKPCASICVRCDAFQNRKHQETGKCLNVLTGPVVAKQIFRILLWMRAIWAKSRMMSTNKQTNKHNEIVKTNSCFHGEFYFFYHRESPLIVSTREVISNHKIDADKTQTHLTGYIRNRLPKIYILNTGNGKFGDVCCVYRIHFVNVMHLF